MTDTFEFFNGSRGFYVFSNTVNWVPYVGQNIIFKREYNIKHDRFAVSDKTLLEGRIVSITFGHVPGGLSRHTWYAIQEGAPFKATVPDIKARPSPLIQGGLEIPIRVKVVWPLVGKLSIYITMMEEIKYPVTGEYVDYLKKILKELVSLGAVESLDDDENEELGDTEDENCKDNDIE